MSAGFEKIRQETPFLMGERIYLSPLERDNLHTLRLYESIGFRREGVQRDGYFYNHQFSNFVMMSILEDEFRALQRS